MNPRSDMMRSGGEIRPCQKVTLVQTAITAGWSSRRNSQACLKCLRLSRSCYAVSQNLPRDGLSSSTPPLLWRMLSSDASTKELVFIEAPPHQMCPTPTTTTRPRDNEFFRKLESFEFVYLRVLLQSFVAFLRRVVE